MVMNEKGNARESNLAFGDEDERKCVLWWREIVRWILIIEVANEIEEIWKQNFEKLEAVKKKGTLLKSRNNF